MPAATRSIRNEPSSDLSRRIVLAQTLINYLP
jgi:hypothetical protein